MATIITKFSSTASAVPTSSDLVQGELAVNTADKRLFTEDSGATIIELGTNPTSVTTGAITASGNVTVGGNLSVTGNATISGNLTFGDADTDSIALNADVDSNILPNTDDTYDLGSATKEWRNLYIDGIANIDSLVADTADINGGTVDGAIIGGSSAAAGTFTTATATTGNITTLNSTTVDTTSLEVTNLKAKDGTSAGSIADSTGVVTIASSVLTTTDINGGSIDGTTIGSTTASTGNFSTLSIGGTAITATAAELNVLDGITATTAELNYTDGVTSNIQTQLDAKAPLASPTFTGTATMDGLTVDGDASVITLNNTDTSLSLGQTLGEIKFNQNDPSDQGVGTVASIEVENRGAIAGYGQFNFKTGSATSLLDRLSITEGGDISFYEDTGTTAKFFWDASAESLGIGTTSPARSIHVAQSVPSLRLEDTDVASLYGEIVQLSTGDLSFRADQGNVQASTSISFSTDGTEKVRITSSGNVGIGTSSPSTNLSATSTVLEISNSNIASVKLSNTGAGAKWELASINDGSFRIYDDDAEKMRIDNSGNVGIGTSSPSHEVHLVSASPVLQIEANTSAAPELRLVNTLRDYRVYLSGSDLVFRDATALSNRVTLDSSGNVLIGTDSGDAFNNESVLRLQKSGQRVFQQFKVDSDQEAQILFGDVVDDVRCAIVYEAANDNLILRTGNNYEALRIDSSGNLLVGKTTADSGATAGIETNNNGRINATRDGSIAGVFNRLTSDGDIVQFRKDGTTVGSISSVATGKIGFYGSGGTGAVIDSSGNVGIGTSSPLSRLDVNTSASPLSISNGTTAIGEISYASSSSPNRALTLKGLDGIRFNDSVSERMRISSSGTLSIGTTSASGVSGNTGVGFTQNGRTISNCDADWNYEIYGAQGNRLRFFGSQGGSTQVGSVTVTTSTTAYNTTSDQRLKENIADADDAGSKVDAIQVRQFDWKADGSHQDYGMIAQELAVVAPEAVTQPENPEDMMGVDYSKLVPMLVKEIQSLRARVAQLEGGQ